MDVAQSPHKIRVVAKALALVLLMLPASILTGCGSGLRESETVGLGLPRLRFPVSGDIQVPERGKYQRVPLVVILDEGPPVSTDLRRRYDARMGSLAAEIRGRGYAVWRPLQKAWSRDRILLRPAEELASTVRLGILQARGIPALDSCGAVLIGLGTGGVVGSMVASGMPDDVRALALINTPARSVDRILASTSWRDSVVTARLRRIFDGLWAGAYQPDDPVLNSTAANWLSWMTITDETVTRVAELDMPVLVVQGSSDHMIPLLDVERFRRAIAGRPQSVAHTAIGVTHDLRDELPDPLQDPDILSPRLKPIVMTWLARVARPSRR